jgi:hypothetical protein
VEELKAMLREVRAVFAEHEKFDRENFNVLKTGQEEIAAKLERMNGQVVDVMYEIGDVPDHRYRDPNRVSLRSRLHSLEQNRDAAAAAGAALGLLFGRVTRWAMLIGILIAAITGMLRLFGVILR